MKSPARREALKAASEPYTGSEYNIRIGRKCARCGMLYPEASVRIDHIERCGELKAWEDLPKVASRMFCTPNKLQVLCIDCDAEKQTEERNAQKASKEKATRQATRNRKA